MARRTLDAMADGGIHDQLGGGFHRYATDAIWLVPHFEQMLYDNAQLARAYLHAWQLTGDGATARSRRGTLGYVARRAAHGRRRLRRQPGRRHRRRRGRDVHVDAPTRSARRSTATLADLFGAAYDVTGTGNWEGRTILRRDGVRCGARRAVRPAGRRSRPGWPRRRAILAERRDRRPQPARDDKVLAGWNGLAIAAFADAAAALDATGDADDAAQRYGAARGDRRGRAILARLLPAGRPPRAELEGRPGIGDGRARGLRLPRGRAPRALRGDVRRALVRGRPRPGRHDPRRGSPTRPAASSTRATPRDPDHAPEGPPGQRGPVGQRDGGDRPARDCRR